MISSVEMLSNLRIIGYIFNYWLSQKTETFVAEHNSGLWTEITQWWHILKPEWTTSRSVHTIQYRSNYHSNVLRIYAHFTAAKSSIGGHFLKVICRIESVKIKNWPLFWSNRMKIEQVPFSFNTQKMPETCQKLAFTHPIVVLKSGLKNNWMQKLDRVNLPL